jgi:hypothetical protein
MGWESRGRPAEHLNAALHETSYTRNGGKCRKYNPTVVKRHMYLTTYN